MIRTSKEILIEEEEYSATPEIPSLTKRLIDIIELVDTSDEEEEEEVQPIPILTRREFLTPPRNNNNNNQGSKIASGSGINQNLNQNSNKNNNQFQQNNNNLPSSGIKPILPNTSNSIGGKGKGKGKAQVIELSDSDNELTPKVNNKKVFEMEPVIISSDDDDDDEASPPAPKIPRQKRKSISSSSTSTSNSASISTSTTNTTKKVEQMTISDSDDELPDRRILSPLKLQAQATSAGVGSNTARRLSSASASSTSNQLINPPTHTTPRPSTSTSTTTNIKLSNSAIKALALKKSIEIIKKGGQAIIISEEESDLEQVEQGGGAGRSSDESESLPDSMVGPLIGVEVGAVKSEKSKGKEKEKNQSSSKNSTSTTTFTSNQSPSKELNPLLPISIPIPHNEKSTASQEAERSTSLMSGQSGLVTIKSTSPILPTSTTNSQEDVLMKQLTPVKVSNEEIEREKEKGKERESMSLSPFTPPPLDSPKLSTIPVEVQEEIASSSNLPRESKTTTIKGIEINDRPSSSSASSSSSLLHPPTTTTTTIITTTTNNLSSDITHVIQKGKGKAIESEVEPELEEVESESPTSSTKAITESLALNLKVHGSPSAPSLSTSLSKDGASNSNGGEIREAKLELLDNLPLTAPRNQNHNQKLEILVIDSDSDYISDEEVSIIESGLVQKEKEKNEAIVIDDDSDFEDEEKAPVLVAVVEGPAVTLPQVDERQTPAIIEGDDQVQQQQEQPDNLLEEDIEKITLSDQELSPTPPPLPLPLSLPLPFPLVSPQPQFIPQPQRTQTQSIASTSALPPPTTSSPARMTARKSTGGRPSLTPRTSISNSTKEIEIISDDSEQEEEEEERDQPVASTSKLTIGNVDVIGIGETIKRRDTARKSTGGRAPSRVFGNVLDDLDSDDSDDSDVEGVENGVGGGVGVGLGIRSNEMSTTPDEEGEEEGFADEEEEEREEPIKIPHPLSEKNRLAQDGQEEEEEESIIMSPRKTTARKSAARIPVLPRSETDDEDDEDDEGFADDPRDEEEEGGEGEPSVGGNNLARHNFTEVITIDSSDEEEEDSTQVQQEVEYEDNGEGFADEEPGPNSSNAISPPASNNNNNFSPHPIRQYVTARKSAGGKSPLIQLQLRQQQQQQQNQLHQNQQFIRRSSPEWHASTTATSSFNEEGIIDLSRSDTESGHSGPSDNGRGRVGGEGGGREEENGSRRRNAMRRTRNAGNTPPIDFTSNKKRRLDGHSVTSFSINGNGGNSLEDRSNLIRNNNGSIASGSLLHMRHQHHRLSNKPRQTHRKSVAHHTSSSSSSNGARLKIPNFNSGRLSGPSSAASSSSGKADLKASKVIEDVYIPATEEEMQEFKDSQMRLNPHDRQIGGPAYDGEFTTDLLDEMGRYKAKATAQKNLDGSCLTQTFQHMMEEIIITELDPSENVKFTITPRVHGKGPFAPEFEFIFTFRVIYEEKLKLLPLESPGCDCEGRCQDNKDCSCRARQTAVCRRRKDNDGHSGHVGFAYDSNSRINKEVLECADAIWECNSNCGCGVNCINRQIGNRTGISVDIFDTGVCGWGVRIPFSSSTIKKGTILALYAGELLDTATSSYREITYDKVGRNYLFALDFWNIAAAKREAWALANPELAQAKALALARARVDANKKKGKGKKRGGRGHKKKEAEVDDESDEEIDALFTVDAFHYGNWTRYVNHSCSGNNVKVANVYVDDARLDAPLLCFVAAQDIKPGEQLTINYFSGDDDPYIDAKGGMTLASYQADAKKARDAAPPSARCYCTAELCRGVMFHLKEDEVPDVEESPIVAAIGAAIGNLVGSIADAAISAVGNLVLGTE